MSLRGRPRAAAVLQEAVRAGVCPAVAVEVGAPAGVLWRQAWGRVHVGPEAWEATPDTCFDLASLTKPLGTTLLTLADVASGRLRLDAPVAEYLTVWQAADRQTVTIRDLLEHASGLPARLPAADTQTAHPLPSSFAAWVDTIARCPLLAPPREQAVYSDLGFLLLGAVLADDASALAARVDACLRPLVATLADGSAALLTARPSDHPNAVVAPTRPLPDDLARGPLLVREVHDNYAAAAGGYAGHAGLFGNVSGVGAIARGVLRAWAGDASLPTPMTPASAHLMGTPSQVPGSSRTLGWDGMRPTSSCGAWMSPLAFGHTGFTGTSVWIDPAAARYYVLLSNRVAGPADSETMQEVRRAVHEALSAP